jgi:hypothetical protein
MAKRGKRPVLDETKKHELLALLAAGCSRRVAAAYVGCSPSTIQTAARRDSKFAEALAHAENQSEVVYLQNIRRAASQDRYWRAAAWVLERRNPQDFAPRPPNTMRIEEVTELMRQFAVIVFEEVPVAEHRKRVLKRVAAIMKSLDLPLDEVLCDVKEAPIPEGL